MCRLSIPEMKSIVILGSQDCTKDRENKNWHRAAQGILILNNCTRSPRFPLGDGLLTCAGIPGLDGGKGPDARFCCVCRKNIQAASLYSRAAALSFKNLIWKQTQRCGRIAVPLCREMKEGGIV